MDKFYRHIRNKDLLKKAGWFNDGLSQRKRKSLYSLDILTTPLHKLKNKKNLWF